MPLYRAVPAAVQSPAADQACAAPLGSRERTLAWITRHRRTVRDYERLPAHETHIYWSMIIVMTRRLARKAETASTSAPAHSDVA